MSKAHELGQGTPQCESWASQRGPPALGRWQPTSGSGPWTPGASVILASEEWMEPRRLSHGADVSIRWDKARAQGMARVQEATIFNFLSVIIIRSACEEEGRRPPGDPHCHGFISGPQGLGDGPPRTVGTSAKWLLGSRKAEGKCCLRLFDLWGGGTRSCRGRWGGGCGLQATLPLPAAHCLWDRCDCLPLPLSLSVLTCSQGRLPSEEHEATRKHRGFLPRWADPASSGEAPPCVGWRLLWENPGNLVSGFRCGTASVLQRGPLLGAPPRPHPGYGWSWVRSP